MCVCVVEKWNKGDATTGCYTIYGIVTREQEEQRERRNGGMYFMSVCCVVFVFEFGTSNASFKHFF